MKKFITFIPRQPEGALQEVNYIAEDNPALTYDRLTRFPIVPAIHGYAKPGEAINIIAVLERYHNSVKNMDYFTAEMERLRAEFGLDIQLTVLEVPYSDGVEAQLETFQKLTEQIDDGDDLFICITYASKVVPIIQTMVVRYASLAKKDVLLRCAVYGQFDHDERVSKIYDVTPLFRMDDILQALAKAGVKDIGKAISAIIRL